MKSLRRFFLFFLINALVILSISFLLAVFGVQPYLTREGLDLTSLIIFCAFWGMGGSLFSLALSRKMAKWIFHIRLIDPETTNPLERKIWEMIKRLSRSAGLLNIPEVGVFASKQLNAFATGPTKNRSLVAVSSTLLEELDDGEMEAVLSHEIAHISNGDMVTMTLIQGIVNAFVLLLARLFGYMLAVALRRGSSSEKKNVPLSPFSFYLFSLLFEVVFMLLGSIVIAFFSRRREYRADREGAMLSSKEKMIRALETLRIKSRHSPPLLNRKEAKSFQSLMMVFPKRKGSSFSLLFATHPPLEKRIARLRSEL